MKSFVNVNTFEKNFKFAMLTKLYHKSIRSHHSWFILFKRQRFFNQVYTLYKPECDQNQNSHYPIVDNI